MKKIIIALMITLGTLANASCYLVKNGGTEQQLYTQACLMTEANQIALEQLKTEIEKNRTLMEINQVLNDILKEIEK